MHIEGLPLTFYFVFFVYDILFIVLLFVVWRVRVQVELGPNNNYNLFSSDLCDVRSKTESFYKVY